MKRFFASALAAILILGTLNGCQSSGSSSQESESPASVPESSENGSTDDDKRVIAFVPQQVGITYFEVANEGAQEAGKEMGVDVLYVGPTSVDAVSQTNIVSDLILQKVDAICIQPTDSESILPILKEAREEGIKVITWGCDVDISARDAFVNSIEYEQFGRHMLDVLAEGMGGQGKYAIITSALTAADCAAWVEAAKAQTEEQYPDMECVTVEPCDDDQDKAYTIAQNLISAYPDLKGILGVTSPAPPAAAQAVRDAGKTEDIVVAGACEPGMSNDYLKDGSMYQAILWDVPKFGDLTVRVANAIVDGVEIQDGTELEGYGTIRMQNNEIILAEPLDITVENVDSFDF
ncbi:MAG: substrate-binding domain-containing protein [Lachnospiraceae bacterium]|jgi:rhamnose transport system substrate-binding protein|nr:substrate-binding domain-containing protein [Lachnospiraceae bacterium]